MDSFKRLQFRIQCYYYGKDTLVCNKHNGVILYTEMVTPETSIFTNPYGLKGP
jgi:hypothetical protein